MIGLESMGLPLPGETILVMASLHAGHRGESKAPVIAAALPAPLSATTSATTAGASLAFAFFCALAATSASQIARIKLGQYLFMKYGAKVVFFGRFVAILRCLAAFLAGVNQLQWPRFLVANAAFVYLSRHEAALEEEAEQVLPGPVGSLRMRRKRELS